MDCPYPNLGAFDLDVNPLSMVVAEKTHTYTEKDRGGGRA